MSLKSHLPIKKLAQILGRRCKRLCVVAVNCLALKPLAFCKAITLLLLLSFIALGSAPFSIKSLTVFMSPRRAAISKGLLPCLFIALGSAPASVRATIIFFVL